jgi:hypothetical protein
VDLRVPRLRRLGYGRLVLYLAELYLPDPDAADLLRRASVAAELPGVRFVEAILVPSDESCFALFDASSSEQVYAAGRRAAIHFDRVVEAVSVVASGPATKTGKDRSTQPEDVGSGGGAGRIRADHPPGCDGVN